MLIYRTSSGKLLRTPEGKILKSANIATTSTTTTVFVETPLTGALFSNGGTSGGNSPSNVFDGNVNTFWDATAPNGAYVGLDLGTPKVITKVKYAPRSTGLAGRVVGGKFQGSNTSFSAGFVDLFTVSTTPNFGVLTEAAVSDPTAYRYVRYLSPNAGYGNIAEVQFFGS